MGLSTAERRAVTGQMARRYERGSKAEKGRILDELCALTGWTRRHARRALVEAAQGRGRDRRKPPASRPRVYGEEVLAPLRRIWATLGGPSGKRLAPFLGEVVEAMERHSELSLSPAVRARLVGVSAATIDRLLAPSGEGWG